MLPPTLIHCLHSPPAGLVVNREGCGGAVTAAAGWVAVKWAAENDDDHQSDIDKDLWTVFARFVLTAPLATHPATTTLYRVIHSTNYTHDD